MSFYQVYLLCVWAGSLVLETEILGGDVIFDYDSAAALAMTGNLDASL